MNGNLAIAISNLTKEFNIRRDGQLQKFKALDGLNLEISKGSVTGIIGRNGAGKSTLLKILSRITYPSAGEAKVRGRLASLLEVGTGFHPELNGRENVFLNGALLGMKRSEIKAQYDQIVAFAGIAEFMDTPVKHYSSGMYVRLAFSVAAHLNTEVLLIDEVLAVGDAAFQKKCLERTEKARSEEGRTVLFVSHNMSAVRNLCDEVIWLEDGRIRKSGPADLITSEYLADFRDSTRDVPVAERNDRLGTGEVMLTGIEWQTSQPVLISGKEASLILNYRSNQAGNLSNLNFRLNIFKSNGEFLTMLSNEMNGIILSDVPEEGLISCHFEELPLLAGEYYITTNVLVGGVRTDQVERALSFKVEPGDRDNSGAMRTLLREGVRVPQQWKVN